MKHIRNALCGLAALAALFAGPAARAAEPITIGLSMALTGGLAAVGKSGLFARAATGLVRGVPPRSSLIINFIPGHPTQTMAAVLLFALAVGPGGNPYLALLLVVPMTLAFAYAFGLLTQMIPRSGGDYMLVSRVVHPAIGYVSVFCMTTAGLLSNAFFGLAVVTAGL